MKTIPDCRRVPNKSSWRIRQDGSFTAEWCLRSNFPAPAAALISGLAYGVRRYFWQQSEPSANDWNSFTSATFIQVEIPESITEIGAQMKPYIKLQAVADRGQHAGKSFRVRGAR